MRRRNPCTTGDVQTILNLDGSICIPCMGMPLDCNTGTTSVLPCDDGNPATINDMQAVLDCDETRYAYLVWVHWWIVTQVQPVFFPVTTATPAR
ncbi:MAG: hypothetical protein R2795_22775 [Saprospiraceae bacterium]